jgi:hypothetical protein
LCNIILQSEAINFTSLFRTSHAYTNTPILSLSSNFKPVYPPTALENNIRKALHLLTSHSPINIGYFSSPYTHVAINADAPVHKCSCAKPNNDSSSKWGIIHSQRLQVWNVQMLSKCQTAPFVDSNHQSFCINLNVTSKASTSLFSKVKDAIMCNNTAE